MAFLLADARGLMGGRGWMVGDEVWSCGAPVCQGRLSVEIWTRRASDADQKRAPH